jgi:hypothetical protein
MNDDESAHDGGDRRKWCDDQIRGRGEIRGKAQSG